MFYFGVEIEAYQPRSPPFLHDSGQHAPIIDFLRQHMKKLPVAARRYRSAGADPFSETDTDAQPWPTTPRDVAYFTYRDSKADDVFNTWKVTTDASIRGDMGESVGGLEFVTPKIPFVPAGIEAVRHFVGGVGSGGFIANDTCAVHVHVSCTHLSDEQIRRFATYLVAFEHLVDQYVTRKRREDNNRYTRSNLCSVSSDRQWRAAVRRIEGLDLSVEKGIDALVDCLNVNLAPAENSERNHKVNFTLLRGTIQGDARRRVEFRQHQGTTDPHVVADWVTFCVKFVDVTSSASESPLALINRVGVEDVYGREMPRFDSDSLWGLLADPELAQRFEWHAKAADNGPKNFAVESREIVAMSDTAYDDMGDITDVHERRQSVAGTA